MSEQRTSEAVSVVRMNAEKDPSYRPYCMRCLGRVRMSIVEPFYWRCACGAEHDEREQRTADARPRHFAMTPFVAFCGADKANQHTTDARSFVSCPECLAKMAAQLAPEEPRTETPQALAYAVRTENVEKSMWTSCRKLVIARNGKVIDEHHDGGEPEDQSFYRDWSWVEPALRQAYEFGVEDGQRRPTATADKIIEMVSEARKSGQRGALHEAAIALGLHPSTEQEVSITLLVNHVSWLEDRARQAGIEHAQRRESAGWEKCPRCSVKFLNNEANKVIQAWSDMKSERYRLAKVAKAGRELIEYIDAAKVEKDLTPSHWRYVAVLRGYLAGAETDCASPDQASGRAPETAAEDGGRSGNQSGPAEPSGSASSATSADSSSDERPKCTAPVRCGECDGCKRLEGRR